MKRLLEEILEIPDKAHLCYQKNREIKLPFRVPYLGMGASYHATLTLFYCARDIKPQVASEYYHYLSKAILSLGVLISQSGESPEVIWATKRFRKIIAITNNPESSLGKSGKIHNLIELCAGEEKELSATKTYINTLVVLYLGLGLNPLNGIETIKRDFKSFNEEGRRWAEKIFRYITSRKVKGLYVIGSGPNVGTACQGALILSETTRFAWVGMPVAQYDHGPKETAQNSVVIILNSQGKDKKRIEFIKARLKKKSNALLVELTEKRLPEELSPLTFIVQLNFLMNYLADYLNIGEIFLGKKITKI